MCQNLTNVTSINEKDIDLMKISIQNLEDKVSFIMSELQKQTSPVPTVSAPAPSQELIYTEVSPAPPPSEENIVMNIN